MFGLTIERGRIFRAGVYVCRVRTTDYNPARTWLSEDYLRQVRRDTEGERG